MATVTRLCATRSIPTVNGRFPGPKIVVREGDRLIVQVHNNINNNVTFHWYVSSIDPSAACACARAGLD